MRFLKDSEAEHISGSGGEPVPPPPPGVSQADWDALLRRLEWERKNRQQ